MRGSMRGARGGWAALVVVLALALSACGGSGSSPDATVDGNTEITVPSGGDPVAGGVLEYALGAETSGWDASVAQWGGSGYTVAQAVFDRLMAYDEDGALVPYLAASMEPNADFTTWTIGLRPDVTFHDGTPFDAEALVANLEAHQRSALTGATLRPVTAIRAVDPLTVEVDLSTPWATFPHLFTAQPGYMMAPAMIDDPQGNLHPVGTGPFRFVEWVQDSTLTVERNPDYWREGFPYLDGIEFRIITDNTARSASLGNGEVQMAEVTDPGQIRRLTEQAEAGDLQLFIDREGETNETFIALNVTAPPFDDPVARQAVAYALDTQTISDTVYEGLFEPARGIFKESSPWYAPTDYPTYDPDRARTLAVQYEEEHGEPIRFTANLTGQPELQSVAQLIQEQLDAVGIEGELNTLEQTQLIVDALGGNYQATGFILFGSSHPDRDYVFLHQDNATGPIALAFTRDANPTLSAALDAARATDDVDEQVAQYAIVQEEMAKDLAIVFLVHNESGLAADTSVRDLRSWSTPDGIPGLRNEGVTPSLYQVWLEE